MKLGLEDAERIEILEGVKPGDRVVTDGAASLRSGRHAWSGPDRTPVARAAGGGAGPGRGPGQGRQQGAAGGAGHPTAARPVARRTDDRGTYL